MASALLLTSPNPTTRAAAAGKTEPVLNAQSDGTSDQTIFVIQLVIYVEHGLTLLEIARLAIKDMYYKMENV